MWKDFIYTRTFTSCAAVFAVVVAAVVVVHVIATLRVMLIDNNFEALSNGSTHEAASNATKKKNKERLQSSSTEISFLVLLMHKDE